MSNNFDSNNFDEQDINKKRLNPVDNQDNSPVIITPLRRSSRRYNAQVNSYPHENQQGFNNSNYQNNNAQFYNQQYNGYNNPYANQYSQQNNQQFNNYNNQYSQQRQNKSHGNMEYIPQAPINDSIPNKEENKKKGFLSNYSLKSKIILGICLVAIVFSSAKLIEYASNSVKQKQAIEEAQDLYIRDESEVLALVDEEEIPAKEVQATPAPTKANIAFAQTTMVPYLIGTRSIPTKYESNMYNRVNERFFNLLDINKDVAGWISMGDFLDQPVMLKNNTYYLNHNYKKEKNPAGAIFIDENCSIQSPPENLILHGHNMKDGSMFAKLLQFKIDKGISFYVNNAIFSFDSLYQNSQYVVFSVFEAETNYKSPNYFPFIAYSRFNNDNLMLDYVRNVKSRSLYSVPVEVLPTDSLITLATCTQTTDTARLIVVGRRIRDGEDLSTVKDAVFQVKRIRK